jgi:carbon monoxide dehydrogenase subunit G
MNISGERQLSAPPDKVWRGIHDVEVLRDAVPGCKELTQIAPDTYTGAASVGIAVIKGLYRGTLRLLEERDESFLRIAVSAQSGHAEIAGEGSLELEARDGATLLRYTGEAHIKGPLAVVGQRLLPSATRSLTEQFFDNLEQKMSEME